MEASNLTFGTLLGKKSSEVFVMDITSTASAVL